MVDNFQEARDRVSVQKVVEYYGFSPNRAGFIRCPFHGEKTASLKLYPGHWYCYGCNKGGTIIDFVMELCGCDNKEALQRLNSDFSLGLDLDQHHPSIEETEAIHKKKKLKESWNEYSEWREKMLLSLTEAFRIGHLAKLHKTIDEWTDEEAAAIWWHEPIESWLDSLEYGSWPEQKAIFIDRKGVENVCRKILPTTPTLSAAS